MWTCRNCNARFTLNEVEPQIDDEGFFFVCPGCDYRNKLVNIGRDGAGNPQLVQRDYG
jgi:transcription initiation factor IIE alpha subunit